MFLGGGPKGYVKNPNLFTPLIQYHIALKYRKSVLFNQYSYCGDYNIDFI